MSYYRISDNVATQKYTIEKLMEEDISALIIKPLYDESIAEILNECIKSGIKVVMVNDNINAVNSLFYVGPNDDEAGKTAGQLVGMFLKGKGKIAVIRNTVNPSYSLEKRYEAFCRQVKETSSELVIIDESKQIEEAIGGYDAYLAAKHYIKNVPDIAGIYNDSGSIYEVGLAVKDEKPSQKIVVVGHEVSPEVNELLVQGYIDAVISQDPFFQGYYAIKNLSDFLIERKELEYKQFLTHTDIILKTNIRIRGSM